MGTKQSGLPAGVSLSQVIDLLNSLETAWGNSGWLDATDAGTGPCSDVVMRIGLPALDSGDVETGSVQSWFTRSQGETVQYFSAIRSVRRKHALPVASHGTLVALSTKKARPSELIVGVVQNCSQSTDIELAPPHATKLGLRLVSGLARAVDVMLPDSTRFEPAYGIFADESDETPSSVLVIAGRCTLPCDMQIRDTEGVYQARLELKIERLAGYERVSVMRIS
jgi:hypothetical protein